MSFTPPLDDRTVTLDAGEARPVQVSGFANVFFYSADGNFSVQFNGGKKIPMTRGKAIRLREEDNIETLTLVNTAGKTITVQFYYGTIRVDDFSLQIVDPVAVQLRQARPDASENLFDATLAPATETTIVISSESTEELLLHNYGANPVEIRSTTSELIDTLAAGEKARYFCTAGFKAESTLGTDLRVSRFFF